MCKDFVTDYEFVKVNEHKSHLLINCTDLEKLDAEFDISRKWAAQNYSILKKRLAERKVASVIEN